MRKKLLVGILLTTMLMIFMTVAVMASNIQLQVDGTLVETDPPPTIVDGRTLLPARAIVEMLGGEIDWDNEARQVLINHGNMRIVLTIDRPLAYVNGMPQELDVAPQILDGRTLVPLRFVAESLGVRVDFEDNTIFITTAQRVMVTNEDFVLSDGTEMSVLYTPVVRRGMEATVFIYSQPGSQWDLDMRFDTENNAETEVSAIGQQTADGLGRVEWNWRIGGDVPVGDWPVIITGSGETLRFYLSVIATD